jgi:hypothetical protein
MVGLGVATGLHTTMTTAETAGIGAVLVLIVWRVDRAVADGLVGGRSSRHRQG